MSTRKVLLCLLCKLPVADGAVASDQVDKKKLRHWYYFVCERKLELKVDDQGSICHYCIWQAEFLREVDSVIKVKTPAWWPQNFDSKGIEKVQRDLFFEGKLNQCWVKMMDFRLLAPQKAASRQEKMKCFFCGKMKYDLFSHLEKKHQNSLNCEIKKCNKYFRTKAEKEMHNEQKHSKGEMRSTYKCDFCPRVTLPDPICFNYHVRKSHADINLKKCPMWNCTFFSKVEGLVDAHFEAAHAIAELGDVFRCHFCEFKSNVLSDLQEHIEGKHMTVKVPFDVCTQTDLKLKSCGVCNRHV